MPILTADYARSQYRNEAYIDGMVAVNEAIVAAMPLQRSVNVTLPLAGDNIPAKIKQALEGRGFFITNDLDWKNQVTHLHISWK